MAEELLSFREDLNQILALFSNAQDISRERKEILWHLELAIGEMSCEEPEKENGSANEQLRLMKVNSEESTGDVEDLEVEVVRSEVGPSRCHLLDRQVDHKLFHGEGEVHVCINIPGDSFLLVNVEQICKDVGSSKWDPGGMEFSLVGFNNPPSFFSDILVLPSTMLVARALNVYYEMGHWDSAYKVFDKITTPSTRAQPVVAFSINAGVPLAGTVFAFYHVERARLVFDGMARRDVISWNAMISGYFENGMGREGLKLFFRMREGSVVPDLKTMTSVISTCELLADERLGREVHGSVVRREFGVDVSMGNSLITMYSGVGCLEEAEIVFSRMECKEMVSWTTMISGYVDNGVPEKAIRLYIGMEAEGIISDDVAIISVLFACTSSSFLDMGIKLHELAKRTGLVSPITVTNTLVGMYSNCKCIDKALQVFQLIPCEYEISWTSIISGAWMCGREFHAHALRVGSGSDGILPNATLDMYVRCGRMGPASNLLDTYEKDIFSWNILLMGYAQQGQGLLAAELFHEMTKSGVEPEEIAFINLLRACSRSGLVTKGFEYFYSMKHKYSIVPNLKHYACVVDLLGRAGHLNDAYKFVQQIPIGPELGEIAARHILETGELNVGYYTLLCNFYGGAGRWDEVARFRKMMREGNQNLEQVLLSFDPGGSTLHPVFRVFLLKRKLGSTTIVTTVLPRIIPVELIAAKIAEVLKQNQSLTNLDLAGNSIHSKGATAIAQALKANSNITKLEISYNLIGPHGPKALFEVLKSHGNMKTLRLSWCQIGATGVEFIADALKYNSAISALDLRTNGLGDEGAIHLAESLKVVNGALTSLDFGFNEIREDGAFAIARAPKIYITSISVFLISNLEDKVDLKGKGMIRPWLVATRGIISKREHIGVVEHAAGDYFFISLFSLGYELLSCFFLIG